MKTIFIACALLTSAYVYQCGLVVPAHPASSAAITLRFPKIGGPARPGLPPEKPRPLAKAAPTS